ncbi:hypothetical protein [Streptomyces zhaozhouensis]|uniref:hypothetical protein n=1 Tax=Streptomyces zhaozhouensis TaxID=1300267 RepID=UPI0014851BD4|nr:hypothetical protein [Streptomyces zhaozhouensis]
MRTVYPDGPRDAGQRPPAGDEFDLSGPGSGRSREPAAHWLGDLVAAQLRGAG